MGWSSPRQGNVIHPSISRKSHLGASSFNQVDAVPNEQPVINASASAVFRTVFDFRDPSNIDSIDRLDDAIMGGISTSSVVPGDGYAKWVGVCRTDGGGFCGFRTNPFVKPLQPAGADGFYIVVRLTSDTDADRRVWKLSTRVKPDRGELLYQAPFSFQQETTDEWSRIKIPFDSFRLVRGPRFVADGAALNTTGGLYQVGMTMSKFVFGGDLQPLDNFRDGFFELQIQEIGLYKDGKDVQPLEVSSPEVLGKEETKKKRPLLLKLLGPVSKLFFSEKRYVCRVVNSQRYVALRTSHSYVLVSPCPWNLHSQRRKQAMKLLQTKRGLSRTGAIVFGLRNRAQSYGWIRSVAQSLSIILRDISRTILLTSLKVVFQYPIQFLRKAMRFVQSRVKRDDSSVNE